MNTKLQWVKKRDGRVVPFQKDKIVQAIYKALRSTGQDDLLTAQEMAEAVTVYLQRRQNPQGQPEIPGIETIQDAVERILIEMKLFEPAKAYILYRDKRSRVRQAIAQVSQIKAEATGTPARGGLRWDRQRAVRALLTEMQLPRALAERIVDIVESSGLGPDNLENFPPDQLDLTIH